MYYNPYIVIPFATWLIAQTLKFAIAAARGELNFKYLYSSGGMPSVHSAVVCSLAMTSLLIDGSNSHIFGFTLLFAAIVMYDSFGVRRSTGEQAAAINMILTSLDKDRVKLDDPQVRLREILGHKPVEVTAGAILGVVLALLFNIGQLGPQLDYLSALPQHFELVAFAAVFSLTLLLGWITPVVLRVKYRGSKIMQQLGRSILLATQTVGWLGVVIIFSQNQHLPYFSYRVWSWLLLGLLVGWKLWLVTKYWTSVPKALAHEQEQHRKGKWLRKKRRKK